MQTLTTKPAQALFKRGESETVEFKKGFDRETIETIVHRDYASSSDSILKIFDDHIEVFNPGAIASETFFTKTLVAFCRMSVKTVTGSVTMPC